MTPGTILIRCATVCLEAAIGALAWRRPDPTSRPSVWRRAFVSAMLAVARGLYVIGVVIP